MTVLYTKYIKCEKEEKIQWKSSENNYQKQKEVQFKTEKPKKESTYNLSFEMF